MLVKLLLFTLALAAPLSGAPATLKVRLNPAINKAAIDLPLESYVAAVLAAESGGLHSDEAIKAMAVAIRSYALHFRGRHSAEGYDLCGTTHCQRLNFENLTPRLKARPRFLHALTPACLPSLTAEIVRGRSSRCGETSLPQ